MELGNLESIGNQDDALCLLARALAKDLANCKVYDKEYLAKCEIIHKDYYDKYFPNENIHTDLSLLDGKVIQTKQRINPANARIGIYIYKEETHQLPHFHIRIGNEFETSFRIDNCQKLAGREFKSKDQKLILEYWHSCSKSSLLKLWNKMQNGECIKGLLTNN